MYGLCQETHWDWIDLDDMNNLADTKGGNINAHIYSNLSAGGAEMLCFSPPPSLSCGKAADALRAELIQKCIFASELFTYRCMIMIPRLIRDRSCCLLSFGALKVTFFFSWPLPRQRSHFTANTLIDADTWAVGSSSSLSSRNPSVPVRQHTGNRCPTFVLMSAPRVQY